MPALDLYDSGLVNGDTTSVFTGTLTTTATAASGVGAYAITQGTLAAGSNYTIIYNPGTLTVTTAMLTVTANSPSKVYGAALPALTYTYSGLVNGNLHPFSRRAHDHGHRGRGGRRLPRHPGDARGRSELHRSSTIPVRSASPQRR